MLHKTLMEAYEWHSAASQLELSNMRLLADDLKPSSCYMHCDFVEKLPIPISALETSDMFHGSSLNTVSVFAAYTVQVDKLGNPGKGTTISNHTRLDYYRDHNVTMLDTVEALVHPDVGGII